MKLHLIVGLWYVVLVAHAHTLCGSPLTASLYFLSPFSFVVMLDSHWHSAAAAARLTVRFIIGV